jgi:hypothetical protein
MKLLGINSVDFNIRDILLIIYSEFFKYLRENENIVG